MKTLPGKIAFFITADEIASFEKKIRVYIIQILTKPEIHLWHIKL